MLNLFAAWLLLPPARTKSITRFRKSSLNVTAQLSCTTNPSIVQNYCWLTIFKLYDLLRTLLSYYPSKKNLRNSWEQFSSRYGFYKYAMLSLTFNSNTALLRVKNNFQKFSGQKNPYKISGPLTDSQEEYISQLEEKPNIIVQFIRDVLVIFGLSGTQKAAIEGAKRMDEHN